MPQNILDRILQTKQKEVESLHARYDLGELKHLAVAAERPRNFYRAIAKPPRRAANLIAEVK